MITIIDTNVDASAHLAALKTAGIRTIIRYLDPIGPRNPKCIKPAEAHAIAAAGLRLALVCEGWGDFAHGGISAGAGERDGAWCARYAPTIGVPFARELQSGGAGANENAACIYFAVDVDANAAQIRKLVLPYFEAIDVAFKQLAPKLRIGVYGSGAVCKAVIAAKLADLAWLSCSMGWEGSRDFFGSNTWALRQHLPQTIAGIDCDPNEANGEFGDFVPFAAAEDRDIAATQDRHGATSMPTPQEYATVAAAVQAWINANAGFYAAMIPAADIAAVAKVAADALDACRANERADRPVS